MNNQLRTFVKDRSAWLLQPRFSLQQQISFARKLSFLLNSQLPLMESLAMMQKQASMKRHATALTAIIADIGNGQTASTSLAKFPKMFGPLTINLIQIGEVNGMLAENLEYLVGELKKKQNLQKKVIGALIYPCIIALSSVAIIAFLMTYLLPKITPIFSGLHIKLPLSTRILISLSSFFQYWGLLTLIFIIFASVAFTIFIQSHKAFRLAIYQCLQHIPIIATLVQHYNLANVSRTLGLLLERHTNLNQALSIVAKTSNNPIYQIHFRRIIETINQGKPMETYTNQHPKFFSETFSQMIAVGERSGNLANAFHHLSHFHEQEIDDAMKNLSTIIEPTLMIIMGIFIGFIAISIITPIYSITQNIHPLQ